MLFGERQERNASQLLSLLKERSKQRSRPGAARAVAPGFDVLASNPLDGCNTSLTPFAALNQTLQAFHGVKAVRVRVSEAERHRVGYGRFERRIENGPAYRKRNRRSSHEGETDLFRAGVERMRFVPGIREML